MGLCGCCRGRSGLSAGTLIAVCIPIWAGVLVTNGDDDSDPPKAAESAPASDPTPEELADPRFVLGYSIPRIDGQEQRLAEYRGRVVLMVNVASRCGLTPQYEALEKLYREHKDDGLVVLGFPANNFNGQEPGTNAEIYEFCTSTYEVTFPMFEKISVRGEDAHPLYQRLAKIEIEEVGAEPGKVGGPPSWNFTKFLVGRDGRVVARFSPRVTPDDERLVEKTLEQIEAGG